jgi:replicative superfamily II helicase
VQNVWIDLLERLTVYASVIKNLDCAIAIDYGAGYENEDEFLLIEVMDTCRDLMLDAIEEQHKDLSPEESGKVSDYLKTESESYSSIDSENRIETAFKKAVSLRKERTGITKDGAYVRVAKYYGNLK